MNQDERNQLEHFVNKLETLSDISLNVSYKTKSSDNYDEDDLYRRTLLQYYKLNSDISLNYIIETDDFFETISHKSSEQFQILLKLMKYCDKHIFKIKNINFFENNSNKTNSCERNCNKIPSYQLFLSKREKVLESMNMFVFLAGITEDEIQKNELYCMLLHSYDNFDKYTKLIKEFVNLSFNIITINDDKEIINKQYKNIVNIINNIERT